MVRASTVMTPEGAVPDAEVVIDRDAIVEIRPATAAVPRRVLVPGFVDLQVNGIGTVAVPRARGGDWNQLDQALLAQGVTTWCPTLVSAPLDELAASCARIAAAAQRPGTGRPHIAGVHLEGPFLTVAGAHRRAHLRDTVDQAWIDSLGPALRVLTVAPEVPGALEAIDRLSGAGVLVSLGHSACRVDQALAAVDAGARLVTHVGNAMGPFHPRAPGLIGAALSEPRLAISIIADLVHSHPAFVRLAFAAKGADSVALVTDAVARAEHAGSHMEEHHMDRAGAAGGAAEPPRLADGTLAGSVLTMDGALGNVTGSCAVSLADAVRAASTTPAGLLGLGDRGAIAPGRRADLAALERDLGGAWRVSATWVAGDCCWTRNTPTRRR
jgi:N-acetylglucosamine-6-phosphate deacetylase